MTVSTLVLILLAMGCGIALGVIGLAMVQAMARRSDGYNPWEPK
jgi:F0F1-type ATP synthase membrane subunit c/vacuolar-type H+-ATPase subunit K